MHKSESYKVHIRPNITKIRLSSDSPIKITNQQKSKPRSIASVIKESARQLNNDILSRLQNDLNSFSSDNIMKELVNLLNSSQEEIFSLFQSSSFNINKITITITSKFRSIVDFVEAILSQNSDIHFSVISSVKKMLSAFNEKIIQELKNVPSGKDSNGLIHNDKLISTLNKLSRETSSFMKKETFFTKQINGIQSEIRKSIQELQKIHATAGTILISTKSKQLIDTISISYESQIEKFSLMEKNGNSYYFQIKEIFKKLKEIQLSTKDMFKNIHVSRSTSINRNNSRDAKMNKRFFNITTNAINLTQITNHNSGLEKNLIKTVSNLNNSFDSTNKFGLSYELNPRYLQTETEESSAGEVGYKELAEKVLCFIKTMDDLQKSIVDKNKDQDKVVKMKKNFGREKNALQSLAKKVKNEDIIGKLIRENEMLRRGRRTFGLSTVKVKEMENIIKSLKLKHEKENKLKDEISSELQKFKEELKGYEKIQKEIMGLFKLETQEKSLGLMNLIKQNIKIIIDENEKKFYENKKLKALIEECTTKLSQCLKGNFPEYFEEENDSESEMSFKFTSNRNQNLLNDQENPTIGSIDSASVKTSIETLTRVLGEISKKFKSLKEQNENLKITSNAYKQTLEDALKNNTHEKEFDISQLNMNPLLSPTGDLISSSEKQNKKQQGGAN